MKPAATDQVLDAAVAQLGGARRSGQHEMAQQVSKSLLSGDHLLVQAGTGTGKSLGYLAPSLVALSSGEIDRVVIATATLALQTQLATKDIPLALDAVATVTGQRPRSALVKGRSNYACLLRIRDGAPAEGQAPLLSGDDLLSVDSSSSNEKTSEPAASSQLGAEVVRLREWAESELSAGGLADRDSAPSHTDRAWSQVSIPVRECLGAQRCPFGQECFVESSRDRARLADVVITNHALLAIDAMHGGTTLPPHDAVVIDEAHEFAARVSGAASVELSPQTVERVSRRALTWLDDELGLELLEHAEVFTQALDAVEPAQITDSASPVVVAAEGIRGATRRAITALGGGEASDTDRRQAQGAMKELFDVAERISNLADGDVVYVGERERFGREVRVAPLTVSELVREAIVKTRTTILCSATLKVGGDFASVARTLGLRSGEQVALDAPDSEPADGDDPVVRWRAVDVGSPFNYRAQAILYTAAKLPPPSREGLGQNALAEIAELVWAADGRTLGLFASRRNAEAAAKHVRKHLPKLKLLCQGEAQLPELTRRFIDEPQTSLFGTLSLWQGVDVPGDTCRLVIIDKIPFPRPDDPLMTARQRAVSQSGGNGFMQVSASHAGLLLAQGSGRMIRTVSDRGVVAVLDPRLSTARYGSFLRAGLPDMWQTTDRETAIAALRRLGEPR